MIDIIKSCLANEKPVPEALHIRFRQILLQYVVVGGMPEAVQVFVDTSHVGKVLQVQRDIIRSYEDDMIKYASKSDKSKIIECFQSIPKQLGKENKKFQYSVVRKGFTSSKCAGSIQWIEDSFKVYMKDTGLFISMLEDGTQFDVLQGNFYGYKGAIFENLIADFFSKMGRKLYYFHKDSGLEVDFVIRYKGQCTLVEVKAADGNTKSVKTILKHPEKYHVNKAIKLCDNNVRRDNDILTLPLYMGFL